MAKALTPTKVDNAKAGDKRREIPDAACPGLYLIVQPSGRKSWAVRYRLHGTTRKYTLPVFCSLKEARKQALDALDKVARGEDPAAAKKMEGDHLYPAVVEKFIERHAKPRNKRYLEAARLLGIKPDGDGWKPRKDGLAEKWAKRRVQDITRRELQDALDAIADGGAPIAANRTHGALRKFFGWCVDRDIIEASPMQRVKAPAPEQSRDRVLTDDELRRLWQACDSEPIYGPMVRLLILTGQRLTEVAHMEWDEIDGEARLWHLPAKRVKNGRAHTVPLSDEAMAEIENAKRVKGSPWVFTARGSRPAGNFGALKKRLDKAMGGDVDPWVFHDLRRTLASGMARLGIDLHIVEKVLNHQSGTFSGVLAVYQRHSFDAEKRQALEAWARFVRSLVEGKPENVVELREAAHG